MNKELIKRAEGEVVQGLLKWGHADKSPVDLMIAITEEVGEVAHAINHNEGQEATRQEIAEAVGLLSRLYDMV